MSEQRYTPEGWLGTSYEDWLTQQANREPDRQAFRPAYRPQPLPTYPYHPAHLQRLWSQPRKQFGYYLAVASYGRLWMGWTWQQACESIDALNARIAQQEEVGRA